MKIQVDPLNVMALKKEVKVLNINNFLVKVQNLVIKSVLVVVFIYLEILLFIDFLGIEISEVNFRRVQVDEKIDTEGNFFLILQKIKGTNGEK